MKVIEKYSETVCGEAILILNVKPHALEWKAIIDIFRTQFFLFSFISELIADMLGGEGGGR